MTTEYLNLPNPVDKEMICLSDIKTLEIVLDEAKEAYKENEGRKFLQEILQDTNCPQLLKDFINKNSVYKVEFETYVQSEDYIPDFGSYFILISEQGTFGFLLECSDSYGDFGTLFEQTEFNNDEHFAETLKEYEFLVPEEEWTTQMNEEALEAWDYVSSYCYAEGIKRKLF